MKNKCKICGAPCRNKFCSEECFKENRKRKYRDKHPAYDKFYVFYDKNDFVRYFGTARQLVEDGDFPTVNAVHSRVSKIKAGKLPGKVLVLNCEKIGICKPPNKSLGGYCSRCGATELDDYCSCGEQKESEVDIEWKGTPSRI